MSFGGFFSRITAILFFIKSVGVKFDQKQNGSIIGILADKLSKFALKIAVKNGQKLLLIALTIAWEVWRLLGQNKETRGAKKLCESYELHRAIVHQNTLKSAKFEKKSKCNNKIFKRVKRIF